MRHELQPEGTRAVHELLPTALRASWSAFPVGSAHGHAFKGDVVVLIGGECAPHPLQWRSKVQRSFLLRRGSLRHQVVLFSLRWRLRGHCTLLMKVLEVIRGATKSERESENSIVNKKYNITAPSIVSKCTVRKRNSKLRAKSSRDLYFWYLYLKHCSILGTYGALFRKSPEWTFKLP